MNSSEKGAISDSSGNKLALLLFTILSAGLILSTPDQTVLFHSLQSDSAMRLVTVRDLLAGQGWYDPTQYRLGTGDGTNMHWSRLVDAPIAGLIRVFAIFTDRPMAESLTLILWPLAMLWIALWVSIRIIATLGNGAAIVFGTIFTVLNLGADSRFHPLNIDHHNIQVVLLLVTLLAILTPHCSRRRALSGGIAMAASLSVGVEFFPVLCLAYLCLACAWVVHGEKRRTQVSYFSFGLAAGICLFFALTVSPAAFPQKFCDALSLDLALPILMGSSALVWFSQRSSKRMGLRSLQLILAFAAVAVLSALFFPSCLSNPLDALDPKLHVLWLDHVSETRGLFEMWDGIASHADVNLGYFPMGLLAILAAAYLARNDSVRRAEWIALASLLALALVITAYQIRGALALKVMAAFPIAVVAGGLRNHWVPKFGGLSVLPIWLVLIAMTPIAWAILFSTFIRLSPSSSYADLGDTGNQSKTTCWSSGAGDTLAELPKGMVSANWHMGADILLLTPHNVLSAPYHRNQAGMLAQIGIVTATDAHEARELLDTNQVDYIVTCPDDPVLKGLARDGFIGFGAALNRGEIPDFLGEIALPDTAKMKIYRVR